MVRVIIEVKDEETAQPKVRPGRQEQIEVGEDKVIIDATQLQEVVRSHWGIENSLHWILEVVFDEDHNRICKDNALQNFAMIRQMALNPLKNEKTARGGIQAKHLQAAWDEDYLLKVFIVWCDCPGQFLVKSLLKL